MSRTLGTRQQRNTPNAEDGDEERGVFDTTHGPVRFYFHQSVKSGRARLQNDIEENGGLVVDDLNNADTMLVDSTHLRGGRTIETLKQSFAIDPSDAIRQIFVEEMRFVRKCISLQRYEHKLPVKKGMGGVIGSQRNRVEFTAEDDDNLCWYLSRKIPDPGSGGRMGNNIYKGLVQLGNTEPNVAWAERHTWHSWRERYRNNKDTFDEIIAQYADLHPPEQKDLYPLDRRNGRKRMASRRIKDLDSDSERTEDEEPSQATLRATKRTRKAVPVRREEEEEPEEELSLFGDHLYEQGEPGPTNHPNAYRSPPPSYPTRREGAAPDLTQATLVGTPVNRRKSRRALTTERIDIIDIDDNQNSPDQLQTPAPDSNIMEHPEIEYSMEHEVHHNENHGQSHAPDNNEAEDELEYTEGPGSEIHNPENENDNAPLSPSSLQRSLSADDAQIHQLLTAASPPKAQPNPRQPIPRPGRIRAFAPPRWNLSELIQQRQAPSASRKLTPSRPPTSVRRHLTPRKADSLSSTPSVTIPTPGTRAEKARIKREIMEKESPYEPLAGTRAASLARNL